MNRANLLIAVAIATLTVALWAMTNRPEAEPPWPERVAGFAFSPMHRDQDPTEGRFPTPEQIDADLALLAGKTNSIRTYTVDDTLAEIPQLAKAHGVKVTLGVWVDYNLEANEEELARMLEVVGGSRNIRRVIVGNEVLLRRELSVPDLIAYLDRVRERIVYPVSTAEPWYTWMRHPELAEHVDFITVHMLPYWEGIDVEQSVDYIVARMNDLKTAFPGKPIIIGEVGWPSRGRDRGQAVASEANEATFLRRFLARAKEEDYDYYIMEAFDQPWKRISEGDVGAYWGVYDVERQPKFELVAPVVPVPEWRALAGISIVIAVITFALLVIDSRTLRRRGRSFLATIAFAAATSAVWVVYEYTQQYLTVQSVIVGILLVIGMIGVLLVVLAEAHEWAEAHWFTVRRRAYLPKPTTCELGCPRVSIHVPAYNEPPEMMIETLDALAALDYPDFEVIVVDNNTKDPSVWQPVEAHCARLGPRFRFFHVDPLVGFKAGALNFALRQTAEDAQIVAVIDSDYQVAPNWLRDLVPQFADPQMAIVQAPQDYRDGNDNAFKAMCYAEYRGFFYIGMITRNERNAIIQHGTMTMVRRRVLEEVGGWAEWTITEDAELGLRIFEHGYQAMYVARSYGRGLMPDNFVDFKKQRFRWAFGAVQIIRGHLPGLMGKAGTRLTWGQRYHFIAGWLPWFADGFNLVFNALALAWSAAMILAPTQFDPPVIAFSALPLTLFAFKVAKLIYLYRTRVDATGGQTLAAAWAGLALTHTIGLAILTGLRSAQRPFLRTPKLAHGHTLLGAFAAARAETALATALILAALGVRWAQPMGGFDLFLWILVLLIQAVPYLAAVSLSLLSAMPRLPASALGHWSAEPGPVNPTRSGTHGTGQTGAGD